MYFTGHLYTQFEKMFMMFDETTWNIIVITLVAGFVIIQVINFCSDWVKTLVFGERVQTPTMNFLAVIFGGGMRVMPERNFARFILMMFIILCLILRTCHQSMLYELMQKEIRHAELKTIDEAINKGYTFYMARAAREAYSDLNFMKR
jgi:hypothetical protein